LKSIEVLRAIQGMANRLSAYDFHPAPAVQPKLIIGGVEVSFRADLVVHGSARDKEQIGAAIFRMTQDDAETDEALAKRQNMGLYVAVMARRHIEEILQSNREPANRLCLSIDIQHGEVFSAPTAITRRSNDLESACRMIAAFWDQA
jgi:hypothetical protein